MYYVKYVAHNGTVIQCNFNIESNMVKAREAMLRDKRIVLNWGRVD